MRTLIAASLLIASGAAQAATIVNGSFEVGQDPGLYTTIFSPDTSITGWTVSAGSIDYIGSYWNASNGVRSIDMSGNAPGTISQTFATNPGAVYTVSFDLSGNPDNSIQKVLNVSAGNDFQQYFNNNSTNPLVWTTQTFQFTAIGSQTTLTFAGGNEGPWGAALDNVSISGGTVPEPASWAMLVTGFGLVGFAARRRTRAVAA